MTITAFFIDALGSALELGVATPDDVLKHATPDVLAAHLPRPEWAKLIRACLAAPRVDARLVVDTITVPVLCAHVPGAIVWACLVEIGQRALGKSILAPPPAAARGEAAAAAAAPKASPAVSATATPPAGTPAIAASGDSGAVPAVVPTSPSGSVGTPARTSTLRMGTPSRTDTPATGVPVASPRASSSPSSTPAASATAGLDEPAPLGAPPGSRPATSPLRTDASRSEPSRALPTPPPGNGIRSTGAGASTRRPQAQAPGAPARPGSRTTPPPMRRPTTGSDFDIDADLGSDWKKANPLAVDDEQLVDWAQADETSTTGPNDRKR